MSHESRRLAGALLVILPTVLFGGASLLTMLVHDPSYAANPLRQDFFRAGHAHAGVYLVLSLVMLRYVDEANLSAGMKWFARLAAPIAAILVPSAFFLSMLSPQAQKPNSLVNLAYAGGGILALGLLTLGIGLLKPATRRDLP